jgi:hypothetical protein
MFNDLTEVYPGLERVQMRAARLPGSGRPVARCSRDSLSPARPRRPVAEAENFRRLLRRESIGSVSYVTIEAAQSQIQAPASFRAEPGEQLWLWLPPEQCRWYDPETQLLLEAKE